MHILKDVEKWTGKLISLKLYLKECLKNTMYYRNILNTIE